MRELRAQLLSHLHPEPVHSRSQARPKRRAEDDDQRQRTSRSVQQFPSEHPEGSAPSQGASFDVYVGAPPGGVCACTPRSMLAGAAAFKNFHSQFINSCVSAFSVVRRGGRPSVVVVPPVRLDTQPASQRDHPSSTRAAQNRRESLEHGGVPCPSTRSTHSSQLAL